MGPGGSSRLLVFPPMSVKALVLRVVRKGGFECFIKMIDADKHLTKKYLYLHYCPTEMLYLQSSKKYMFFLSFT